MQVRADSHQAFPLIEVAVQHYNHALGQGKEAVLAECGPADAVVDIQQGDGLLIPTYWWHLVESGEQCQ